MSETKIEQDGVNVGLRHLQKDGVELGKQGIAEQGSAVMSTYARFPLTMVKGKGSFVWDDQGVQYLDYTSGIAVCNLGHVPGQVQQALENQLQQLWHCSNLFHIPSQQELASLLTEHSFADQVFFCNSGAEANEAAIKIARRYAKEVLKKDAYEVVTFEQSFHGRTLATLSATGQEKIQAGFQPLMPGFRYLPFNDQAALDSLATEQTCAVLLELVQGEGGVIPAELEWVQKIAQICAEQNILLMVDEIQTGMSRTGTLFAYQQYGIQPDLISLAKGLGSGFPIGAILATGKLAAAFEPGTHGSTFGGNPLATTAGLATLQQMVEPSFTEHLEEISAYFQEKLENLKQKFSLIKGIRGLGLLQGLLIDEKIKAIDIVQAAREHKILILTAGINVVRLLPPLTTSKEEIDQFISIMSDVLATFEHGLS